MTLERNKYRTSGRDAEELPLPRMVKNPRSARQQRCHVPLVPALGKQKQESLREFKANLVYSFCSLQVIEYQKLLGGNFILSYLCLELPRQDSSSKAKVIKRKSCKLLLSVVWHNILQD